MIRVLTSSDFGHPPNTDISSFCAFSTSRGPPPFLLWASHGLPRDSEFQPLPTLGTRQTLPFPIVSIFSTSRKPCPSSLLLRLVLELPGDSTFSTSSDFGDPPNTAISKFFGVFDF